MFSTTAQCNFDPERYEILLDDETMQVIHGLVVPSWLPTGTTWTANGFDPTLFPQGKLPMKRIMYEDGENYHSIAALAYAMAHRANNVTGPPAWLFTFKLSSEDVNKHTWDGSLKMASDGTHTLAIMRQLDPANYPGLRDMWFHRIEPGDGDQLLEQGRALIRS